MASLDTVYRLLRPLVRSLTDRRRVKAISYQVDLRFPEIQQDMSRSLIIDLGANRGDFTIWAAKRGGFVISIEPDPLAFVYLARRCKKFSDVHLLNCAVSDKTEIGKLYHHINRGIDPLGHTLSSSIDIAKKNVDPQKFSQILILNLSNLFAFPHIKILKIDIEGGEKFIWEVIEMNYEKIEYLLIELHASIGGEFKSRINSFIQENELGAKWKSDWI
jgi:FkbM family methyltransferase